MGRNVGGTTKHTKVRNPNVKVNVPVKTNTSKHPKVYRPKPNYKTVTYSSGLKHTTGVHGASYGVTRTAPERVIQQKQRTATVNLAHKVRFVAGGQLHPNLKPNPNTIVRQDKNVTHSIKQGTGNVVQGNQKFIKKKTIHPQGAGTRDIVWW